MSSDQDRPPIGAVAPAVLLALPLAGLALLLAQPDWDVEWQHHPSHFWLVLATAAVSVALGVLTNGVASRHRDARLVLMSLAFLSSAGFLGLHALATPGVLLPGPNAGFVLATPIGLVLASVFAALSATPIAGPRAGQILRRRRFLLAGLVVAMLAWATVSLAGLPPLNGPPPDEEATGLLNLFSVPAIGLFAFSAWRSFLLYRARPGTLALALGVACVLLGEAMVAVIVSRNWHLSWWEWHLLLLAGFGAIALGTRDEYRSSGSVSGAFGGLYLEATLARIDRWHARAIAAVAGADARGEAPDRVIADLRREGASPDELALLRRAAGELRRLDALFRPFLPTHVADRLRVDPAIGELGGVEREVSVLFADLAGFTAFSERRAPSEVLMMLNEYWAVVVPVIDAAGGVVEQFAGDGVMVTFNAVGDQADHPARAARAGLAIVEAVRPVADAHAGWPIFRVGVNTGQAVVGNVGVEGRRSFAVIGNTTNVASRLMAAGSAGQVVVAAATWNRLGADRDGSPLGLLQLKGKRAAVEAWLLRAAG